MFVERPYLLYLDDMTRFEIVWRILTLRCEEASRLSSESPRSPLPGARPSGLEAPLLVCVSCRRYRRDILTLRRISTRLAEPVERPLATLPDDARERIRRSLKAE